MSTIPINGTFSRNTLSQLANSIDIMGSDIYAADLTALQNYADLAVLKVGQWCTALDTGKKYVLTTIGTPPSVPHILTELIEALIQLNPVQKFVSPVGNDANNGQIDRKKLTIENALASMDGQSSADVDLEDGTYAETLTFGTTRSRRTVRGTKGSDRVVITRTWTFNENCQQACLTDLKFDNTTGYCIDVNSTLGGFKFDGINIGGSVTSTVCIKVRAGGSGFITIVNGDFAGKIIQLDNTVTPRYLYLNNCVNASIDAGTGWIVIKAVNCQNIFEISSNNNILAGYMANSVLTTHTDYLAVIALGAAGNGYYLCNYTEAGVFSTGDVILRINPITVVDQKYYNAHDVYYVISTLKSYFKKSGSWKEIADATTLISGTYESNIVLIDQNLGNDSTGIVGDLSKPFKNAMAADAAIAAITGGQALSSTNRYTMLFASGTHTFTTFLIRPFVNYICSNPLGAQINVSSVTGVSSTFSTIDNAEVNILNLTFITNVALDLFNAGGTTQTAKIFLNNTTFNGIFTFYGRNYSGICNDQLITYNCAVNNQFLFDSGILTQFNFIFNSDSSTKKFMIVSGTGTSFVYSYGGKINYCSCEGINAGKTSNMEFIGCKVAEILCNGLYSNVRSDATSLTDAIITYNNSAPPVLFDLDRASEIKDDSTTGTGKQLSISLDDIRSAIYQVPINNQTDNYLLALTDINKLIEINNVATKTVTVPTNAAVAFPIGTVIAIIQQGVGQVIVAGDTGVNVRSAATLKLRTQYSGATLIKRATDEWYLTGDLEM